MQTFHLCLLGLCLLLFVSSATTDLALPGPQDDECVHACLAMDMMHPPYPFGHYRLRIGNHPFPFGVDPHTGALKAYMLWGLFSLFGPSVELMRLFTISLGLLTLLFGYLFVREISGPWPGFFSLLLLSLDSSFLFYSKLDAGPIMEQLLWMMISLWGFAQWRKRQKSFYLLLILLSGLFGIYSHVTFIWFLSASLAAALLCFPKEVLKLFKRQAAYLVIPATFCMLSIFLYWLMGEKLLLSRKPPGFSGASLMLERVSLLAGIVPDVLLGKLTPSLLPPLKLEVRPPTDIFLASAAVLLLCRYRRQTDLVRFLFFIAGIIFLEISWTPTDFTRYPHRLMLFYLFLIFFGGLAIAQSLHLLRNFKSQRLWLKVASSGILLLALLSVSGQILLKQEADQKIRQTGGKGFWSDGMYAIAETLKKGQWEKVVCLDWGFRRPLFLLTKGELLFTEPLWGIPADERVKQEILLQVVQQASPRTLFLLKPAGGTLPKLRKVAQEISREIRLEQVFRDRGGDPVSVAYTAHIQSP